MFEFLKRQKELPKEEISDSILQNQFNGIFHRVRNITPRPNATDITIGAKFDISDAPWMEKQFKLINHDFKKAYIFAWNLMAFRMRYYQNGNVNELKMASGHYDNRNRYLNEAYKKIIAYENNILRADNDQTCECKPTQIAIKEDMVTNFGLSVMIENFMVFNALRFDTMEVGSGSGTPFGGDKALQNVVASTSLISEGYAIPYGVEARHGAPFLASQATARVAEVGIKDSISTRLYSRSIFPFDRIIEHEQNFDAYSINHITMLKAI